MSHHPPDFFRFPSTPHLAWLGGGQVPRDDKLLSAAEVEALLAEPVVVEEKLDGANLGISLSPDGELRAQNRGQYLFEPHAGQFARLPTWLAQHADALHSILTPERIVFGEWCAARHSLDYTALPDWFLVFDIYDRAANHFWSTRRRDELVSQAGLATVPRVLSGITSLAALTQLIQETPSQYRAGQGLEGVVVRREDADWGLARAKLVRADFTQAIEEHWRRRQLEWNRLDWSGQAG